MSHIGLSNKVEIKDLAYKGSVKLDLDTVKTAVADRSKGDRHTDGHLFCVDMEFT